MPLSITPMEDYFVFQDETVSIDAVTEPARPPVWRLMIVDDDADVHSATVFALGNVQMQKRPLEFLHAYTAAQARELLVHEQDIAVILLDVVMEQQDAGLQLVRHIRETLEMKEVRIILHTGQPGYAPELDAIRDFDINDYKTKSELTRIKLFTAVTSAIRSYEQICAINASRRGLDYIVRASTELMALQGLQNFASGVINKIAGLVGALPQGIFCAIECDDELHSDFIVIAGAGKYAGFSGKKVSAIDDARATNALLLSSFECSNVYSQNSVTLYFIGNNNRNYVAFLDVDRSLNATDQRLLDVFCSNITAGLANVTLLNRLHNFAFFDELSKLPNRTQLINLIDDMLATPARNDKTLSLVDIDHFAEINDALGHEFGDLLLLAVAGRLQSRLGDKLTVARVGGDTFSVLGGETKVNPVKISALFNTPFFIDGEEVQLSATVGLLRLADHQGDGAEALKDANIALKRAKLHQRTGHYYFSRRMGDESRERVKMMHALRTAFENGKLTIAYQPQINLNTREVVGAEALLRWTTDDGKLISPDSFIPIAEYSGLIISLGEWVLRAACQQLVHLRDAGFSAFFMSINVSQVQFRHPDFLDMLYRVLRDTGAPPAFIELEITESMAMQEPGLLIDTLAQIKKTGISIAIDDFGTGFSSLSYLQQLQVDRLKIDRSFVTEITTSSRGGSIAEMVIQLAQNLGLAVIAEGVENEQQAAKLASLGCPLAQGNLFALPMTREELMAWLQAH
jgi:diguanylate cyclase (GGDEF)-like protein